MLAINMLTPHISYIHNLFGTVIYFTTTVNFKLNTIMGLTCSVKYRIRLVAVILDKFITSIVIAIITVWIIIISFGAIFVNE